MNKPEYGDFYKFIASIGIVLLSLALLLPWLILREPFDVLLKSADISQLTPVAQQLITYRQNTALWWVQNIPLISGALAFTGFLTLIAGIILWRNKQKVLDQKDRLEIEKLQSDLSASTPAQIAESKLKEAEEQVEAQTAEAGDLGPITPSTYREVINQAFMVEKIIADKLRACFGSENLILTNQQIQRTEYDVILRSGSTEVNDVIFEIKYASKYLAFDIVERALEQLARSTSLYRARTDRSAIGVVFIIAPKQVLSTNRVERLRQMTNSKYPDNIFGLHIIAREDLEQIMVGPFV